LWDLRTLSIGILNYVYQIRNQNASAQIKTDRGFSKLLQCKCCNAHILNMVYRQQLKSVMLPIDIALQQGMRTTMSILFNLHRLLGSAMTVARLNRPTSLTTTGFTVDGPAGPPRHNATHDRPPQLGIADPAWTAFMRAL
jgi:hypothetical protein